MNEVGLSIGEKVYVEPVNKPENQMNIGKCVAMAITENLENIIYCYTGHKIELSYDWLYMNRLVGHQQGEALNVLEGVESIAVNGMLLESEFNYPNVNYQDGVQHLIDAVPQETKDKGMKYALEFKMERIGGYFAVREAIRYLKQGRMLLTSVANIRHEMALCGIERVTEDLYDYTFSNSWEGQPFKTIRGPRDFLSVNDTYMMHVMNPEILDRKKVASVQVDNPNYMLNGKEYTFSKGSDGLDTVPFVKNGRMFVPLDFFRNDNKDLKWNQETLTAEMYNK